MKRRTAIRNVIILGAGASWLASCKNGTTTAPTDVVKKVPITEAQSDMLNALTETIIPTTDFVGAKELQSADFIVLMAEDCASPEDQQKFMDGMARFEEACQKKYSNAFVKCSDEQRLEFLTTIESKTDVSEDVINFYQWMKEATIQSFITSEEYLTKVKNFSLIPGPYQGCVPVESV
jgi:hypothetical protein